MVARVEKGNPTKEDFDSMKKDVVREVKKRSKRRHPVITCGIIALVFLLAIMLWALWSLAATGLFNIPIFTSLAYSVPEPTREVSIGAPLETHFETQLSKGFSSKSISLSLPEDAFTATLRTVIEQSAKEQFDVDSVQIAVLEDEGLEVFLPLANNKQESALKMILLVHEEDGRLVGEVSKTWIGSYRVPGWMVNLFIEPVVKTGISTMSKALELYATVEQIEYNDASVIITGQINQ